MLKIKCIGCDLQKRSIKTIGGAVVETKNFSVQQDYEFPIPGFLIVSSKRHVTGIADFTKLELKEFIELLQRVRIAMQQVLKIKFVTYFCREETIEDITRPSHFHMAVLPTYKWMDKHKNISEIFNYAIKNLKTQDNMREVKEAAINIKKFLDQQ